MGTLTEAEIESTQITQVKIKFGFSNCTHFTITKSKPLKNQYETTTYYYTTLFNHF